MKPFIKNSNDFADHVDLIGTTPAMSEYKKLAASSTNSFFPEGTDFDKLYSRAYGLEYVNTVETKLGRTGIALSVSSDKAELIKDALEYVEANKATISDQSVSGLIHNIAQSCTGAEEALATSESGATVPDPRYKSCRAGADALVKLAALYGPGTPVAERAINTLLDLGEHSMKNIEVASTMDTGIIIYGYVQALQALGEKPGMGLAAGALAAARITAPPEQNDPAQAFMQKLGVETTLSSEFAKNAAMLLFIQLEKQEDPVALNACFNPLFDKYVPMDTMLGILTEGLRVESSEEAVEKIGLTLNNIMERVPKAAAVGAIQQLDDKIVRARTDDFIQTHDSYLGGHFLRSAPLVVAELKRNLGLDSTAPPGPASPANNLR